VKLARLPGLLALAVCSSVLALLLAEGAASFGIVVRKALQRKPIAERSHTRYDPELGWVNRPGVFLPDLYRAGASVTIDADGFRTFPAARRTAPRSGDGTRRRWVCSGDSFTFGFGVDDRETWCALLALDRPDVETFNLGQGGYGLDQVYLWYRRESGRLRPERHLIALDVHLFPRLARREFVGYGKPLARLRDGRLEFENIPVARRPFAHPRWTDLRQDLRELALARLAAPPVRPEPSGPDLADLARSLIAETVSLDRRLGTQPVLVFLPVLGDHAGKSSDAWRARAALWAREMDLPLIDLVPALRLLSAEEARGLFIPEGDLAFQGAGGHPSAAGNRWIAAQVTAALAAP